MIKYIVALILVVLPATTYALDIEPAPTFNLGVRFGDTDINDKAVGVIGLGMDWLKQGDDWQINLLSPKILYQTDNTIAPAIGVIGISTRTDYFFSIDAYPFTSKEQYGGDIGFTLGLRFP